MKNSFKKAVFLFYLVFLLVGTRQAFAATTTVLPVTSNLKLWFDATDVLNTGTNVSAGPVSIWKNKAGNSSLDLVQGTSGNQPTFSLTGLNGTDQGIVFDGLGTTGTTDFMQATGASASDFNFLHSSTGKGSVYVVLQQVDVTGRTNHRQVFSTGNTFNGGHFGRSFSTNSLGSFVSRNAGVAPTFTPTLSAAMTFGTKAAISNIYDMADVSALASVSASSSVGSVASAAASDITTNTNDADYPFLLGGVKLTPSTTIYPAYAFEGTISEVIVYDTKLTCTQDQAVRSYLSTKWGVTYASGQLDCTAPRLNVPVSTTATPNATTNSGVSVPVMINDNTMSLTFDENIAVCPIAADFTVSINSGLATSPTGISCTPGNPVITLTTASTASATTIVVNYAPVSATLADAVGNITSPFANIPVLLQLKLNSVDVLGTTVTLTYNRSVTVAPSSSDFTPCAPIAVGCPSVSLVAGKIVLDYSPSAIPSPLEYLGTTTADANGSVADKFTTDIPVVNVIAPVSGATVQSPISVTVVCPSSTAVISVNSTNAVPNPTRFYCSTLSGPFPMNATFDVVVNTTGNTVLSFTINDGTYSVTSDPVDVTVTVAPASSNSGHSTTSGGYRYCTETITTNCRQRVVVPNVEVPTPSTCSISFFTETMKTKQSGTQTVNLQKFLNNFAKTSIKVDNIYGSETTASVRAFQQVRAIKVDSIVGPITRGEIHKAMCEKEITVDEIK